MAMASAGRGKTEFYALGVSCSVRAGRNTVERTMTWTVIDAVLAAIVLRYAAQVLDPNTLNLAIVIAAVAVVWHFVRAEKGN